MAVDQLITGLQIASQLAGPFLGNPSQIELKRQAPFAARTFDALVEFANSPGTTDAQRKSVFEDYQRTLGRQFGDIHPLQTMANFESERQEAQLAKQSEAFSAFDPRLGAMADSGTDPRIISQFAALIGKQEAEDTKAAQEAAGTIKRKDFQTMKDRAAKDVAGFLQDGDQEAAANRFEQFQFNAASVGFNVADLADPGTEVVGSIFNSQSGSLVPNFLRRADRPIDKTSSAYNAAIFGASLAEPPAPVQQQAPLQQGAPVLPPPPQSPVTGDLHPAIQQGLDEQRQAQQVSPERFATAGDITGASLPIIESPTEYAKFREGITVPQEIIYQGVRGTIPPKNELLQLPPTAEQIAEESVVTDGPVKEFQTAQKAAKEGGASDDAASLAAAAVAVAKQVEPLRVEAAQDKSRIEEIQVKLDGRLLSTGGRRTRRTKGLRDRDPVDLKTSLGRAGRNEVAAKVKSATDTSAKDLGRSGLKELKKELTEIFTDEALAVINDAAIKKEQEVQAQQDELEAELQQRQENLSRLEQEIDSLSSQ